MSYENSANVKFNDATDLIIKAKPDGTVVSCFNRSNNREYVGGGSPEPYYLDITITGPNAGDYTVQATYADYAAALAAGKSVFIREERTGEGEGDDYIVIYPADYSIDIEPIPYTSFSYYEMDGNSYYWYVLEIGPDPDYDWSFSRHIFKIAYTEQI